MTHEARAHAMLRDAEECSSLTNIAISELIHIIERGLWMFSDEERAEVAR